MLQEADVTRNVEEWFVDWVEVQHRNPPTAHSKFPTVNPKQVLNLKDVDAWLKENHKIQEQV